MSTDLVKFDVTNLPSTQLGNDAVYDEIAKSGEFLGRLQLYTKGKAINQRLVQPGSFGIPESAEEIIDLGEIVDLLAFARRPKALDMTDTDAIIAAYDPESPEFKRIAAQSGEKESHCMYGPSFLVFERTTGRFLEFFCGSKSTRGEAKKIYPYLPLTQADIDRRAAGDADVTGVKPHGPIPFSLKSKLVEKGPYSWHVPVTLQCSKAFNNLPPVEKILAEIEKFLNPKEATVEVVEEEEPKAKGKKARVR